jgi:hypothetical protein
VNQRGSSVTDYSLATESTLSNVKVVRIGVEIISNDIPVLLEVEDKAEEVITKAITTEQTQTNKITSYK